MILKNEKQENHLTEIVHLLSMYQVLSFSQFIKLHPELSEKKLFSLLQRLEKRGRLSYTPETGMIQYSKDCSPNPATIASFWVLLDFWSDATYHTASDFPVSLTFYTEADAYDVIYVSEGKETLLNHTLSNIQENAPLRLVIVEHSEQIPHLHFPGIVAFCKVTPEGQIQYYKKQGVTDT